MCRMASYPVFSILRAGNGLIDGFSQICPEAVLIILDYIVIMKR